MAFANINGDVIANINVILHSGEKIQSVKADEIVVHRMPAEEREPSLTWLIKLRLDELNDELQELLATAHDLRCECETPDQNCHYAFADVRFLGAEHNTVKLGASIISQAVKLK